ncbi:MAG: extracellular solute-binding protein [Oscillospiraceae bacterium]
MWKAKHQAARIVTDGGDYNIPQEKQILSMSASGEYDLVWVPEVWIPEYVANGWLLPLDSYIARDDLNMDDYLSGIVEIGKVDGTMYAMPDMMQGMMMTYNTEWLEREGQNIPPPRGTSSSRWRSIQAKLAPASACRSCRPGSHGPLCDDPLFQRQRCIDADGSLALTEVMSASEAAYSGTPSLVQYAVDGAVTLAATIRPSRPSAPAKCPFGITMSGLSRP